MTDAPVIPGAALEPLGGARRRDPDERRAQIVAAAFAEFGEKGFDAARLDDVARRAGIAKGTIYLHFADKAALFREMLERVIAERIDRAEAEPPCADPYADFQRTVRAFWGFLMTDEFPVMHRLVTAVLPRFPELAEYFHVRGGGRVRRLLARQVDAVIATGRWRETDAVQAAAMLHSLMLQLAAMRAVPGTWATIHIDDEAQALARVLAFFEAAMRPDAVPTTHRDA
jgi:AcrR family transcriptional regulator